MISQTKLPNPEDTIIALSSARGAAARAIVRLSGRQSFDIAISACAHGIRLSLQPGRLAAVDLYLKGVHAPIAADLYCFRAPHTYTGQDMVELHLVSCQPILDDLIGAYLNAGARAAAPGEFTMRAFLAGKLDLTRAEAVLGVIEAEDRSELQTALTQLAGGLAKPMALLREDLLNLLADVEAGLDFADEDIRFVHADDVLRRLGKALAHFTVLKKQLERRSLGARPFRVVLAGKPNAGKSSLFNALIERNAALVAEEPGTTRDYLEARIEIEGARIDLVDTAGLGAEQGAIDATSQSLGREQSQQADLVLWCSACDDVDAPPSTGNILAIYTKGDLGGLTPDRLVTSVRTGAGLNELRTRLGEEACAAHHSALAPSLSRCQHHVDACLLHLQHAHSIVIDGDTPELLALDIRLTLEELGAMVGAVYTNDLLDRLFSRFCIGK